MKKVSKSAWLAPLALGLLAPPPAPPPPMQLADAPDAASLAHAPRPAPAATCANARRELRFEMITADVDPHPPGARSPAVCLAVYRPR
jgi:hypothetical protein